MSAPLPRRWWLGAGALALAGGVGVGWWRHRTHDDSSPVGDDFWQAALQTPTGASFSPISLRGRPLVVNFWASWCPPCVREMPELDRFAREAGPRGWQVLGLALDQAEPVQAFLRRSPVSFPVALAGSQGLTWARDWGNPAGGLPFSVRISAQGAITARQLGAITLEQLQQWAA